MTRTPDNPKPPATMTLARFEQLLDAYGAEPARWPSHEREAALALLEGEPRARAVHNAALALDAQLDNVELPEPSAQLRARVLEIPIRHEHAPAAAHARYRGLQLALLALVPCVMGFFSGALLLDRSDNDDEVWNEVASFALLSDVLDDDEEELQ